MNRTDDTGGDPAPEMRAPAAAGEGPRLIDVYANRPAGYEGTCLRPLGLCELGGSCDTCWYSPDHPRHQQHGADRDA